MRPRHHNLGVYIVLALVTALPVVQCNPGLADATTGGQLSETDANGILAAREPAPNVLDDIKGSLSDAGEKIEKFGGDAIRWIATGWQKEVVPFASKVVHDAGKTLNDAEQILNNAAHGLGKDVMEKVEQFKSITDTIASYGRDIQTPLVALAEDKGMDKADVANKLNTIGDGILAGLQEMFPPLDQAPSHEQRKEMVQYVLTRFDEGFVSLLRTFGVSDEKASSFGAAMGHIVPYVTTLVVAIGDLIEQHPHLFYALTFFVLAQFEVEQLILRALLDMLGFGNLGPIKGSAAAWAQGQFFGAAVDKGSWFAVLQKTGMAVAPKL